MREPDGTTLTTAAGDTATTAAWEGDVEAAAAATGDGDDEPATAATGDGEGDADVTETMPPITVTVGAAAYRSSPL